MIALKNILVATDFGEASDAACPYGRALARSFGATLHLFHATEEVSLNAFATEAYAVTIPDLQREVDEAARNQLDGLILDGDGSGPAERSVIVMSSTPALAIVEYAKDHAIDLIVMGTHGRGPLAHLMMGSVAERVVRLAPCPVLTVRHPEHEFVHPDALPVAARSRA